MQISIIAIGKVKEKDIKSLIDEYLKRNPWKINIIELESKEREEKRMKQDEGEIILSRLSDNDFVIILEENAMEFTSPDFAKYMQKLQVDGNSKLKFVIGGASGISNDLRNRANASLSLGKLTYPHKLARMLLVEQLYRVWTIIEGRSYHK